MQADLAFNRNGQRVIASAEDPFPIALASGSADGSGGAVHAGSMLLTTTTGSGLNSDLIFNIDTTDYNWVAFQLSGTWVATVTAQGSFDGGVSWNSLGMLTGGGASVSTATVTGIFLVQSVAPLMRLRVTAYTSGTITMTGAMLIAMTDPLVAPLSTIQVSAVSSIVPGVAATNLGKAEDAVAANGDTGVATFGVRGPTTPAAQTSAAGDYGSLKIDAEGNQVFKLHAIPDLTWQVALAVITVNTAVQLRAAQAAGLRTFLTDITVSNGGAAATLVTVLDGATVIWQTWLAPGVSVDAALMTPLRGTAATALSVQASVAGSLYVAASGFTGI